MDQLRKMKTGQLSRICQDLDIPSRGSKAVLRSRIMAMQQSVNYRNFGPRKGRGILGHKVVCCIPGCNNFSGQVLPDGHEISLHPLPTGPKRDRIRTEWKRRLVNADVRHITDNIRVCSTHFTNRVMNVDSIPTIFPRKLDRIELPSLELMGEDEEFELFTPRIKKRKCRRLYFKNLRKDSPRNESFPGPSRMNWF
ncbi:DgyrCDS14343 [Dimorphilus gyrociliatus]|nr:DgyrCDS14343 [Dimorphilus gyrociliatus]